MFTLTIIEYLQGHLIFAVASRFVACILLIFLDIVRTILRRLAVHRHKGMHHNRLKFRYKLLLEFQFRD